MTNIIAVDRTTVRRNVTVTGKPPASLIDALIIRTGFQYDERSQQWWKMVTAGDAIDVATLQAKLDDEDAMLQEKFKLPAVEGEDHLHRYQSYYTSHSVAAELVELAGIKAGMTCLEPSAGHGALAIAMHEAAGDVQCIEVDPMAAKKLNSYFPTKHADFLQCLPGAGFDRIVMNPPFSRDQDARHVCHAFNFLKPGGKLVAIVGSYALNGKTDERRRLMDLVRRNGRLVRELPPGTFDNNARAVIIELVSPTLAQAQAA